MKKIVFLLLALSTLCHAEQQKSWFNYFMQSSPVQEQLPLAIKPKVAVISIGDGCDITQAMFNITNAAKNNEIAGILLNIDCNGGAAARFSALHDLIKKVRLKKPIVGLVIGSALSAGYLIGSATDYLIAQSVSEIGSIGCIVELHKYKEPKVTGNVDAKLEVELFHAGEYKAIYHPYQTLSEQERAYIKTETQKSYEIFLKIVAENKNLDLKNYKTWAEGKIHFAPEALQLGLIDEIGTIFEAEAKLLELMSNKNPDIAYDNDCEFIQYGQH